MQALANSSAFWTVLLMALSVLYLLPTMIAVIRGTEALALVILVNLIGAPIGIGWLAAMILAFGPRRLPPAPPASYRWRSEYLPEPEPRPAGSAVGREHGGYVH